MKKPEFTILPANASDYPAIQQMAWEIWPSWYASIISMDQIEYMLRHFYSPEGLEKQAKTGQQFFLARENHKPVGFLGLSALSKEEWKLDKLYLLEITRGKGYGKMMMDFALDLARKNKAGHLILNVNRFNDSRDFYFSMGFRIRDVVDIPLACFWLNDFIVEKSLR